MSDEYLTMADAARYVGVSRIKLSRLAQSGRITYTTSALDGRVKLFRRADLDELRKEPRAPARAS